MGKNVSEKIKNRKLVPVGSKAYDFISRIVMRCRDRKYSPEYVYHFDEEEMKGKQIILLADHAAWDSFFYVISGYPFVKLNTVVGYHHIFKRFLYSILIKVFQVIPKKNYQNDMLSMKQMLQVVKKGGSLLIFPEGTQSKTGSNVPLTPSTAGFLKKLGLPVVLCKSYGSYLARPLWKGETNSGHQEFHYELLFDEEELKEKDKDLLYAKLLERFRYSDFEWNEKERNVYDTDAVGMEKIIYTCPRCGKKFHLRTTPHHIECTACGLKVKVNEYLEFEDFTYKNIDEWYKEERRIIRREIEDPDFKIEYDATIYALKEKLSFRPYEKRADAHVTIDAKGITIGDTLYDIEHLPSILVTPGEFNLVYYKNELLKIVPKDDKNICMRNMIAIEELHAKNDRIWAEVLYDAYD